ncbi:ABC transporter substrate-binding protein [Roseovarius indicus]|uniref:Cytochrome C n=1 Tax=Roseovarius indicus TaxID=540747 RepID=A0A0T5PCF5_9RHOB|nr:ABC transporter substrate-binding protein [Roseovarius indicus]KRS18805.1 cytochrome C [Roseovarius indicus]OAO06275.1 nickel/dipeptide/oligopeptide ABC transporter substrate-binding protein [Roseovarius indicus]QEW26291.1 Hemin-binding lipoprotein [Roseovarius indicus]SFD95783.1 peptide/nickel transport system substrate-binding protein [Roseovarius indicus]
MKVLRNLATASAILVAAAGMGSAQTLNFAYDADPVSLDPHEQLSGGTLQLSHMVFDPLVRWNKDLGFDPRIATEWERIDDTTMLFHIREGVKFHSGNDLTAEDVVYTIERLKSSPDFKGIFAGWSSATAVDDYTVEVKTDGPSPLILHTATYVFPLDKDFYTEGGDEIAKHGDSFASQNVSGTGPFTIAEREQGVKVTFERNPDYWDTDSPGNVQTAILTPIKEAPTRVAALLSGDVDFIAPVPPTDLERIENNEDTKLVTMTGTRIITLQMNQERNEALADVKVRQAIVHAINNEGIVQKIMKGFGTVAAQQSPEGYVGHNPNLEPRFDVEKAKALMEEAGYADGFSATMMCPNNRYVNDYKICEAAAAMLAKIGIEIDLTTMPKAQYWPKFDERAADIMMIGWHSDTEDSANFNEFLTMTPNPDTGRGQYNSGNYSNEEVDRLTMASLTETDEQKRADMLQTVEQILYDEAAFVPLHWQDLAWAARTGVDIEPVLNVMNFPYLGDLVIEE